MSAIASALAWLVLATAVVLVWVCIVGMLRAQDAFARLHFPGAAVLVGAPGVALALSIAEGLSPTATRAWLISALLILTNGILTHATARAEWLRRRYESEAAGEEEGPPHDDP